MKKTLITISCAALLLVESSAPAFAQSFWAPAGTPSQTVLDSLAQALVAIQNLIDQLRVTVQSYVLSNNQPPFAPGRILVKFQEGVSDSDKTAFLQDRGLTVRSEISQIKVKVISVPQGAEQEVADALSHNPKIKFAEVDRALVPSYLPNDPGYSTEWHLPKINAPSAWDTTNGSGVTVAIADSGTNPVQDLAADLVPGWNFYDNNSNTADVYGHGTETAGTAAEIGDNAYQNTGVAYKAYIMPLRVTDTSGYGYVSDIDSAITYAADHGAKVVNLSFGGVCGITSISSAGNYMMSKGGLVVVAAGNTGTSSGCSADPNLIFVSATDSNDNLASWSTYGPNINVSAPGVGICTTNSSGGISCVSGTSFSAPNTVGTLALEWAANSSLTPSQAQSILQSTAVDLGATGWDQYFGWGRINAGAAVAAAKSATSTTTTDTTPPTASITSPLNGATVGGTVVVSASASDNVGVTKVEFYKDGSLVGTDTSSPYSFSWNTYNDANGSHSWVAKAYDAAGNVGTSNTVTVTVSNVADTTAPTVSILSPAANSKLPSKGTVSVSAGASDDVSVSEIDVLFDGVLRQTCTGTNITSCSYNLNVKKVPSGNHTITVNAYDPAGNKGTASETVTK